MSGRCTDDVGVGLDLGIGVGVLYLLDGLEPLEGVEQPGETEALIGYDRQYHSTFGHYLLSGIAEHYLQWNGEDWKSFRLSCLIMIILFNYDYY